jgi:hypothetical protein
LSPGGALVRPRHSREKFPSRMLKKDPVMLSAAKHLLYLIENKQKQILRFAQNDVFRTFFSILLA